MVQKILVDISPNANSNSKQNFITEINEIENTLQKINSMNKRGTIGHFEWIDGVLIQAMEHGHWLLIDNVCCHFLLYLIFTRTIVAIQTRIKCL